MPLRPRVFNPVKLVKIFIGLLVVIMVLYFLLQNTRLVTVDLIFVEFPNAPVSVVMLGSLGVGILFGYAAAVAIIISGKSEIRLLKNKNKKLSDELNDLRNVSIEESIYDNDGNNWILIRLVFYFVF